MEVPKLKPQTNPIIQYAILIKYKQKIIPLTSLKSFVMPLKNIKKLIPKAIPSLSFSIKKKIKEKEKEPHI